MGEYAFSPERIARRTNVSVIDKNKQLLNNTSYSKDSTINSVVKVGVAEAYEYMRSGENPREKGQRPAQISVLIYYPINDAQSKELNADNASKARTFGGIIGVIGSRLHPVFGVAAGAKTFKWAQNSLGSWDSGDILIRLEIAVPGGIGPQRTIRSVVIKRSAYDENKLEL